eukprot:gene905-1754_t
MDNEIDLQSDLNKAQSVCNSLAQRRLSYKLSDDDCCITPTNRKPSCDILIEKPHTDSQFNSTGLRAVMMGEDEKFPVIPIQNCNISIETDIKAITFSSAPNENFDQSDSTKIPFWPPTPNLTRISSHNSIVNIDVGVEMISVIRGDFRGPTSKMNIQQDTRALKLEDWEYPGWGTIIKRTVTQDLLPILPKKHRLNVYSSTSIAGNDLLASVLYTTGILCSVCGQLAPIAVILCCMALYPFRKIFQECGTALPLNGGVYVALLNSASKFTATFAASCSLISYAGTAVVSAASCTSYAYGEFGNFLVIPVTIAVLAVFGLLVVLGVKDSASVALAIFVFHLITLIILLISSLVFIFQNHGDVFMENLNSPLPISDRGIGMDLYLGFSVALLGVTGFETSANYIEEAGPFETERMTSKKGGTRVISVFEKTIANMWILVVLINPAITTLSLGVVDLPSIIDNPSNVLSVVGERAGGIWLRKLVAIDAVVVLAGGVLTSYVGVSGLIKQLAADRCLPSFLLQTNSMFCTHHWIILSFFILCVTLYSITNGDVVVLSGVFAIAFLMVLIMFALANMRLKFCRPRLPRGVRIGWSGVIIGFIVMTLGLIGNIIIPMLEARYERYLCRTLIQMKKLTVVFFAKSSELHILNKAILYARDNELCDRLIIVHIYDPQFSIGCEIPQRLQENLNILDHIYPKMKIDLLLVEAEEFNPQLVKFLSKELKIQTSFMFIRCPGEGFPFNIGEFDGVRTIMK